MTRIILFVIFYFTFQTIGFSQSTNNQVYKGNLSDLTTFGGIAKGEISIMDKLEDSLSFCDPFICLHYRIVSFHLAVKCNGHVLKYMENKSGNKLTEEMKEAIREVHPGCTLTFDGIKSMGDGRDVRGTIAIMDFGMVKLTLK